MKKIPASEQFDNDEIGAGASDGNGVSAQSLFLSTGHTFQSSDYIFFKHWSHPKKSNFKRKPLTNLI